MNVKERIERELQQAPERLLPQVLDFVRFLKAQRTGADGGDAVERVGLAEGLAAARRGQGLARFVKGDVVVVPFPFSEPRLEPAVSWVRRLGP